MKKKNLLTLSLSLALVGAVAVGSTLAYFSDYTATKTNTFTAGNVDIDIVDTSASSEPGVKTGTDTDDGITYEDVMPGDTLAKKVGITVGTDSNDCYVAIKITVTAPTTADSKTATSADINDMCTIVDNAVSENDAWVSDAWQNDGDNKYKVFYCKTQLSAEDSTVLFSKVKIPLGSENTWSEGGMSFNIVADGAAVQADNMDVPAIDNDTYTALKSLLVKEEIA